MRKINTCFARQKKNCSLVNFAFLTNDMKHFFTLLNTNCMSDSPVNFFISILCNTHNNFSGRNYYLYFIEEEIVVQRS